MKTKLVFALMAVLCLSLSSCTWFAATTVVCGYAKTACLAVTTLCGLLSDPNATSQQIAKAQKDVDTQVKLLNQEATSQIMYLRKVGK